MKKMMRAPMDRKRNREAGNIFFMLFASIAVIGAMTAGAGNIVKGIVTSMSDVTRKTITEEKMQGGARISIQSSTGCDIDTPNDFMEPTPFRDAAGKPHPVGGGLLPEDIGATLKDPWGTEYGYCAWNFGDGVCAGSNLIPGPSDPTKTVVAVISAGKDRKFSTTCNGGNTGPIIPADCTGKGNAHYNDSATGHCYFESSASVTHAVAQATCVAEGGYLAVPNSSAEWTKITTNLSGMGWLGLDDTATEGKWVYSYGELSGIQFWNGDENGSPVGGRFNAWNTYAEPNNFGGSENCAIRNPGNVWADYGCGMNASTLCEIPPSYGPDPASIMDCSGLGASHYNDPVTGHCYFRTTATAHGDHANDACAAEGAYLATITSAAEQIAVQNLTTTAFTWIGADDAAVDGTWNWSFGPEASTQFWAGGVAGAPVGGNYTNWMTNEPNGAASEAYAAIHINGYGAGKWVDEAIWNNYNSICEKSPPDSSSGVSKADGSDDIVMEYTYNDANGMSGNDLWKINDTKPGSAKIDKNIDVAGGADLSGPLNLMKSGLILPGDGDTGACDDTTDQQIRINFSMNPPTLEICNYDGGAGDWTTVSMGGSTGWAPPSGIVSWWKMDETTGTTVEDTTGSNDGVWSDTAVTSVPGVHGTALYPNGTDHITVPDDNSLDLPLYTVSAWVKADTPPNGAAVQKIFDKNENFSLNWNHTSVTPTSCEHDDGGGFKQTPPTGITFTAGEWYHIACTYNGTSLKIYINGIEKGSVAAGTPVTNGNPVGIGSMNSGNQEFPGAIDDVMIFDRALSRSEIENIYYSTGGTDTASLPSIPAGYVGYWKFDEGSGSTAADSSGNNLTGTIDGATWTTGKNGDALQFDGDPFDPVTDTVDLGSPALLNIGDDMTVGAWVNLDPTAYGGWLYTNGNLGGEGLIFGLTASSGLIINSYGYEQIGNIMYGDWHYVTLVFDSGVAKYYIDGILYDSKASEVIAGGSPTHAYIGPNPSLDPTPIAGAMDDFIIYDRALDDTEVVQLFQSMGGVDAEGLPLTENFLLDPRAGQCASAGQGPFIEVGTSDSAESYENLFSGKNYLFSGGLNSGISAFTRNGDGTVTRITTHDFSAGNMTYNVYTDDDQTIFAANGSHGLTALTFNGTTFTEAGTIATPDTVVDVATYGKYILVAASSSLGVYTYAGGAFTEVAWYTPSSNDVESMWTDGKYIYVSAWSAGLRVITFDGANFEDVAYAPPGPYGADYTLNSTGDGKYIYVNNLNSMDVYAFDGKNLILKYSYDGSNLGIGQFRAVYADGQNIFLGSGGGSNGMLTAMRFDGEIVTAVGSVAVGSSVVWGSIVSDGGYIYAGLRGMPMRIFSGFSCNTGNNNFAGFPASGFNPNYGKISSASGNHVCALKPDGSAWCWGLADRGQIGNGVFGTYQTLPAKVLSEKSFSQIATSQLSTCAIDTAGSAWCWGEGSNGQIGNGVFTEQTLPKRVSGNHKFTMLTGGADTLCGIDNTGDLYCWGRNDEGGLGDGTMTNRAVPTLVLGGHKWVYVSTSGGVTCGIDTSGKMWCWGSNYVGGLGIGIDDDYGTYYTEPQLVADPGPWLRVANGSANCAIKYDGTAWCWGQNEMGTVGLGLRDGTTWTNKPKRIADRGPWKEIAAGNISCGIKQDGTAWCWGVDSYGALGNNGVTDTAVVPFPVSDPGPWSAITATAANCGMKVDGSFWCWGADMTGALGNGPVETADKPIPQPVLNMPGNAIWSYGDTGMSISAAGTANIAMGNTSTIGYKAAGPTHDCAGLGNGTYFNDPATGHCYFRGAANANWNTAQATCAANGGYLAAFTSEGEQSRVRPTFGSGANFWIGASDASTEGSWLYTGGELAGNKFWNGNQTGNPQNGLYNNWFVGSAPVDSSSNLDCAWWANGTAGIWQAADCATSASYICEIGTAGPRGGLSFPTGQDRLLSNYDSPTELAIQTTAVNTSAQFSWKVASTSNVRTMGVDYNSKAFAFELNTTAANAWLHDATYAPQLFINTDGRVGIGVAAGTLYNKLTLGGGLRVGNDTSNCHIMRAGTLRYVGGAKPYKYCNGTAWVDF